MAKTPEILEVNPTQLQELLRRVEAALDESDATLIRQLLQSYVYLSDLVEGKHTSICRLRELLFGKSTEKTAVVLGRPTDQPAATPAGVAPETLLASGEVAREQSPKSDTAKPPAPGHGRNGADAYTAATRVEVPHPSLSPGDACPTCQEGTLYERTPGELLRISGQPPVAATLYELQKLRCHLCGQVFTAEAPAEAGEQKYQATAGSMIALLKYGSGLPFNRLAGRQGDLEVPCRPPPSGTSWRRWPDC
jgi:hypothetical protein